MTAAFNGTKPPTRRYVFACPACDHLRPFPDHPPSLWTFTCDSCGSRIEVNTDGWPGGRRTD